MSCFNPRTRAGCDPVVGRIADRIDVSIHAPVQGATLDPLGNPVTFGVSIHAPVQGATIPIGKKMPLLDGFNPRTRAGCDSWSFVDYASYNQFQSTHPCRVRLQLTEDNTEQFMFQSTHPCRVRPFSGRCRDAEKKFQSTHPCRVRLRTTFISIRRCCFNPRTRAGCDSNNK